MENDDPEELYLDLPPPAAQRITELHVWVATYHNGSQGIVGADMPMPDGLGSRHMPLLSSNRDVALRLEGVAQKVRRMAMTQSDRRITVELVTFRRAE